VKIAAKPVGMTFVVGLPSSHNHDPSLDNWHQMRLKGANSLLRKQGLAAEPCLWLFIPDAKRVLAFQEALEMKSDYAEVSNRHGSSARPRAGEQIRISDQWCTRFMTLCGGMVKWENL